MRNSMFFPGDTPQLPTRDPCWTGNGWTGLVKIGPVMIVMIGPAIVVGRVLLTKQCENLVRCCQTMIALVVWVVLGIIVCVSSLRK